MQMYLISSRLVYTGKADKQVVIGLQASNKQRLYLVVFSTF